VRQHHPRVLTDAAQHRQEDIALQRLRFVDLTSCPKPFGRLFSANTGLLCRVHVRDRALVAGEG
jgi:hypothetical protein